MKLKSRIKTVLIRGLKRSDCSEVLNTLLSEIDNELAFIEDIAKGELGMKITELRKKINE